MKINNTHSKYSFAGKREKSIMLVLMMILTVFIPMMYSVSSQPVDGGATDLTVYEPGQNKDGTMEGFTSSNGGGTFNKNRFQLTSSKNSDITPLDTGGPDIFGYEWVDSNPPDPTVSYTWVDGITGGTATGLGDDDWIGPISMGMSIEYYGIYYDEVYIMSNGWISFVDYDTWFQTDPIPGDTIYNGIISPFSCDLNPASAGEVYYRFISGTPNQFVVTYDGVPYYGTSDYQTFQIVLNETGDIWFNYQDLNNLAYYNVGIENEDSTDGLDYDSEAEPLSSETSIMFYFNPLPHQCRLTPEIQGSYGEPGTEVDYTMTVMNDGLEDDIYDLSAAGNSWDVNFFDMGMNPITETNLVPAGDSEDFIARVSIPGGALEGDYDIADITVTSQGNASVNDTAQVWTQVPGAPFLLVDDSGSADCLPWFHQAFTDNGLDYDYWDTLWGTPTAGFMDDYDVVVWTTGDFSGGASTSGSAGDTLNITERDEIETFLNNNGRFYMSSGGLGWDGAFNGWANWIQDNFGAFAIHGDLYDPVDIVGVPDDPIGDGLDLQIHSGDHCPDLSGLWTLNDLVGETTWPPFEATTGEAMSTRIVSSRAVYTAFDLADVNGQANRSELLVRILDWLLMEYDVYLSPDFQMSAGAEGTDIDHLITVNNVGTEDDTYALSVSGNAWDVDLFDMSMNPITDIGPVPAGDSVDFIARVIVDGGASPGDFDMADITATSQGNASVGVTAQIRTQVPYMIPWFDDMESGEGGWIPDDDGSTRWELGNPTGFGPGSAYSPVNCWGTNLIEDYDNNADVSLVSPAIDASDYPGGATLSFWMWFHSENGLDSGWVEVSTDGSNWEVITPDEGPAYEFTMWGEGYTGDLGGWHEVEFDLAGYTDGILWFRFRFRSDSYVTRPGWYIDDVGVNPPPPYRFVLGPESQSNFGDPGTEVDHVLTVTNTGMEVDTYDLSVTNSTWTVDFYDTSMDPITNVGPVVPGDSDEFIARVSIPGSASMGEYDLADITATSQGDPDVNDTVEVRTEVLARILLVEDDHDINSAPWYVNALDDGGYEYNLWQVESMGSPSLEILQLYYSVIWFTGNTYGYYTETLSATDRENIENYLSGGGSIYLSGSLVQYDAYNVNHWGDWFETWFHTEAVDPSEGGYGEGWSFFMDESQTIYGYDGDPIGDGMVLDSHQGDHCDELFGTYFINTPIGDGESSFYYDPGLPGGSDGAIVRADTGTYRTVFSAFDFADIDDATVRATLMDRILQWILPSNLPPDPPGIPSPSDGAVDVSINPMLSVVVTDPDEDFMTVSFYDAFDDSLIGTDTDVYSGDPANVEWTGLEDFTEYGWYAVADDGEYTTLSATWHFTTGDSIPPTVIDTEPSDGALDVEVDTSIIITFSTEMETTSVEDDFTISPHVSGTFIWDSEDTILTYILDENLTYSTSYEVTIGSGSRGKNGVYMETDHQFSFTADDPPDQPPEVIIHAPSTGYEYEFGDTVLIDWTASDDNPLPEMPITIEISYDSGTTWENLVESINNTGSYSWTPDIISNNVRIRITCVDSAGQYTTVSTGDFSIVDTSPPVVVRTSPEDEEEDVSVDTQIIVEFNEAIAYDNIEVTVSSDETDIEGTWELSNDEHTLIFTPDSDLKHDTRYTVVLDAEDHYGNGMEHEFSFTTGSGFPSFMDLWWLLLIAVIIVIAIIIIVLKKKGGKGPVEEESPVPYEGTVQLDETWEQPPPEESFDTFSEDTQQTPLPSEVPDEKL